MSILLPTNGQELVFNLPRVIDTIKARARPSPSVSGVVSHTSSGISSGAPAANVHNPLSLSLTADLDDLQQNIVAVLRSQLPRTPVAASALRFSKPPSLLSSPPVSWPRTSTTSAGSAPLAKTPWKCSTAMPRSRSSSLPRSIQIWVGSGFRTGPRRCQRLAARCAPHRRPGRRFPRSSSRRSPHRSAKDRRPQHHSPARRPAVRCLAESGIPDFRPQPVNSGPRRSASVIGRANRPVPGPTQAATVRASAIRPLAACGKIPPQSVLGRARVPLVPALPRDQYRLPAAAGMLPRKNTFSAACLEVLVRFLGASPCTPVYPVVYALSRRCIETFSKSTLVLNGGRSPRPATHFAQGILRADKTTSRFPDRGCRSRKFHRVLADRFRRQRFHCRLEHRQRSGRKLRRFARLASRLGALVLAKRARTSVAQKRKRVDGPVPILPLNSRPVPSSGESPPTWDRSPPWA